MKKAQTEIAGLTIIVILVALIFVFAVRLSTLEEKVDYKKEFTQSQLASNMIDTLLKLTSRECSGFSMTDILRDCSQNQDIICGDDTNSCDYFSETTQQIFSETLDKWNINYDFKVFYEEEEPLLILGNPCVDNKKSNLFPIPSSSGILSVKLDICG